MLANATIYKNKFSPLIMKRIIILTCIIVSAISCKKYSPRKIIGSYEGYTFEYYFQMGSPLNKDTTFYGTFELTKVDNNIQILDKLIPADSLKDGSYVYENGVCFSEIYLKGDTIDVVFCNFYNSAAQSFYGCHGVKVDN